MQVAVIGAGVGGLVTALRLAKAGHTVTVFEKNAQVGGKLSLWEPDVPGVGAFRFDTGPHVLTMPWAIRELFEDLGERMEDYLHLVRIDPICRYHFADGTVFDAPADPDDAARAVAARFPEYPGDVQGFRDFLTHARRVHDLTVEPFLRQDFSRAIRGVPTPKQWGQLSGFLGLAPWKTIHQTVARYVRHPKLRQIFDLYAFYNGSSPHKASGIFSIIAWVQWGDGTFYLRGGLRTYADALVRLATKFGVTLRTQAAVTGVCIEGATGRGRVTGVEIAGEGCLPFDAVVCNADPLTAYETLIPETHRPPAFTDAGLATLEPSTSAFLLLLGVSGENPLHLRHYNSFLPTDGDAEYTALFERGVPGEDPVIGITCQSVTEPGCAPPGHANLFVMTSPPPLRSPSDWTPEATAAYRDRLLTLLETRCGLPGLRGRIVCEQVWTPRTFEERYGAFRGSLYGLSSNGWRSAFLRPPNTAKGVRGLYFVGGGTHPGGGLPLVTLGGKIVAETILEQK
ncbi:MAG: phytoene desaturase [Cytophagales bacterium]|nr:phytoene desaturase [Armatimonadota bacterium]